MSEVLNIKIDYDVTFSPATIEQVIDAINVAVIENWQTLCDRWSTSTPELLHKQTVLEAIQSERMKWLGFSKDTQFWWNDPAISFQFSPASCRWGGFRGVKYADGHLGVYVHFPGSLRHEIQGEREQERMEGPWDEVRLQRSVRSASSRGPDEDDPAFDVWWAKWNQLEDTPKVWLQNKKAIQNIAEKLHSVLPVRSTIIDEELLENCGDR